MGRVLDALHSHSHNCLPLLEPDHTVFGTVQRDLLCALLSLKAFSDEGADVDLDFASPTPQSPVLPFRAIARFFPSYPDVDTLAITKAERQRWLDLRPYCNTAPYTVNEAASVPRTYRLFRLLGMRHLLVVDRKNCLVGVITRHDLLEEHILAALQHSPLLRTQSCWTMRLPPPNVEGGGNEVAEGSSPISAAMP